jgi:hypothetical protein
VFRFWRGGGGGGGGDDGKYGGGRVERGRTGGAREKLRTCTVYILVLPSGRRFIFIFLQLSMTYASLIILLYKFYIIFSSLVPPLFEFKKEFDISAV